MSDDTILQRAELAKLVGISPRLIHALENQSQRLVAVETTTTANVDATDTIRNATYVTLSANAELPNERVLGLAQGLEFEVTDTQVIIHLGIGVPYSTSGHSINFATAGDTSVALPLVGILATLAGVETFSNKTLATPKVSGLGDYADDTAAASGGVPVTGLYRTGSNLKVRVT